LRNIIFFLFVLRWTRRAFWKLRGRGIIGTVVELYRAMGRILYGYFLRAPGVRGQVKRQVDEALAKVQAKMIPKDMPRHLKLPKDGRPDEELMAEMETMANMDHTKWEKGYVSGAVYHGEDDLLKLQMEAFGKFTVANPIHPDVFPGVRKMEAEIVSMVLSLFHAPQGGAGVCTAGGTESILVACLAARERGFHEKGIKEPEM
jgi:sphinganine-1-phosphate aldolase